MPANSLEARFGERILAVSNPVVRRWGAISGAVKRAVGHSPSVVDTLLAATALEHDLYLVTRNVRDVQHSGAAVFNPWTDDVALFPVRHVVNSDATRRVSDAISSSPWRARPFVRSIAAMLAEADAAG